MPGPQARSCTAMKWLAPQPQGPSLGSGLFCPGPSSLNRPHPPHSQAHRDFTAQRLIRDAFAVRERLGDPRVVPSFRWLFLPDMPSSASPGSSTSHCPISRCRHGLRHTLTGSTLPNSRNPIRAGPLISGLTGSPLLRPVQFARLPCRIRPDWLPAHRRLLRPGFRSGRSPRPTAGYDYDIDWTPMSAGLAPAGIAASFAALATFWRKIAIFGKGLMARGKAEVRRGGPAGCCDDGLRVGSPMRR